MREIATVAGGSYSEARNHAQLDTYFQQQRKALLDTYESMQCKLGNAYVASGCNTTLILVANRYIDERGASVEINSPQWQAYQRVKDDIAAANLAFQEEANKAQACFSTIWEQVQEQRRQLNKSEGG